MTPDPGEDENPRRDQGPRGTVHPTSVAALCSFGGLGLVVGWAIRPVALQLGRMEPTVSWPVIGLIWFVAASVAGAAYLTWRGRRDGVRLEPHRAVNRLVLGKACALVGALLGGGYFGFALAHLGVTISPQATTQLWHAALAGVGGLVTMAAALLLEQACRVPDDPGDGPDGGPAGRNPR